MMLLELKYPIWLLSEIARVSKSAYYKYKRKPLSNTCKLDHVIIDIYNKSNKRAGYRAIKDILKFKYHQIVNHKKVQRIMCKYGIQSIVRKKHKKPKEQIILKKNILNRNFKANKPGEKYVTDITYIPTRKKMMYLSMIIDVYDNLPVAWNISDNLDKSLSIDTIRKLSEKYSLKNCIIHSDQGIHYTNKDYVNLLKELGVEQSMSRKGNCWDNAVAESFFSHYKCESIYLMDKKINEPIDVIEITEEYIDYYSNQRPQRRLGGLPPSLYRQNHMII